MGCALAGLVAEKRSGLRRLLLTGLKAHAEIGFGQVLQDMAPFRIEQVVHYLDVPEPPFEFEAEGGQGVHLFLYGMPVLVHGGVGEDRSEIHGRPGRDDDAVLRFRRGGQDAVFKEDGQLLAAAGRCRQFAG